MRCIVCQREYNPSAVRFGGPACPDCVEKIAKASAKSVMDDIFGSFFQGVTNTADAQDYARNHATGPGWKWSQRQSYGSEDFWRQYGEARVEAQERPDPPTVGSWFEEGRPSWDRWTPGHVAGVHQRIMSEIPTAEQIRRGPAKYKRDARGRMYMLLGFTKLCEYPLQEPIAWWEPGSVSIPTDVFRHTVRIEHQLILAVAGDRLVSGLRGVRPHIVAQRVIEGLQAQATQLRAEMLWAHQEVPEEIRVHNPVWIKILEPRSDPPSEPLVIEWEEAA